MKMLRLVTAMICLLQWLPGVLCAAPPPLHKTQISKVDLTAGTITVSSDRGEVRTYRLTAATQIVVNDQRGVPENLLPGMNVDITTSEPGVAERVTASNGLLIGGRTVKDASGESKIHVPATAVGENPVIVGGVKAGQVVTVVASKVWWTGGGTKAGVYCDWNGYKKSKVDGHPWMALVAAVGKSTFVPEGATFTFTVPADGTLVLYANDDKPEGNFGAGDVTVTVMSK